MKAPLKEPVKKSVEKSEGHFSHGMDSENSRFSTHTRNSGLVIRFWTHKAREAELGFVCAHTDDAESIDE